MLSKTSFYKHRRDLLEYGIDIAIRKEVADRTNVIPLVRVLEAVPVGVPKWAIRLVMSQRPTLDRFGWKDWEIRKGLLHYKQLSYRYYWTPVKLVLPLYNIRESDIPWQGQADNLSALEQARKARKGPETPKNKRIPQSG